MVLAILAAVCAAPLATPGWFENHEGIRPIARALAAYHEVAGGDLFPRWISSGYLGKGAPLFNFYPPAFSLLVAYAHALGVPVLLAAKLVLAALFFAGAAGAYLWARPHLGPAPALVSAILYLFAPYHFVDLYVRGATAEFTALAALPFMFLAMDRIAERASAGRLAGLAFASAAVVVAHFLGALMIAPFAVAYAVGMAIRGGGVRALARVAAGTALGAALCAFYWLPALAEVDALSPERRAQVTRGYYAYAHHLVFPSQWLDTAWGFGNSMPGDEDGMSFQVGVLLLVAAAASAAFAWAIRAGARRFVVLGLALGAAALWLTSASAAPLYAAVPPLQLVQFPWRFLGPVTLFLAAGGGGCLAALVARRPRLAPWAVAAVGVLAVLLSREQRAIAGRIVLQDERRAIEAAVAADPWTGAFGNEDEFLPRDASVDHASTQPGGPNPTGLRVEISGVRAGRAEVSFEAVAEEGGGVVVIPWHAFPGWEVTIDGRDRPLVTNPFGLVAFDVPPGSHAVRVHFGTTAPRLAGWALCLIALAALGGLAVLERVAERRAVTSP